MAYFIREVKWATLIAGDFCVLYLSLFVTLFVRYDKAFDQFVWQQHFVPFTILYLVWFVIFYVFGLYNLTIAKNNLDFYVALLKAVVVAAVTGVFYFYLAPFFDIAPKTNLFINILLVLLFIGLWRQLYNFLIKYPLLKHNILIIGNNLNAVELKRALDENPQLGVQVVAIIDPDVEALRELSKTTTINTLLVATDLQRHPEFAKLLVHNLTQFSFSDFASFYEHTLGKAPIYQIDEMWLLTHFREQDLRYYELGKRAFDLALALLLGLVTLAILPMVALAIKLNNPGPIFYQQWRMGRNSKLFTLYKFRSMVHDAEKGEAQWAQENDPRITSVGRVLRKTFLDEFPQFINVLKGEMSFIGPRPERPEFIQELEKKIPFYQIRHIIKPGITGWAQTCFPYGNSLEGALEKLQYEIYYIKNRSLFLDVKILLKTINIVAKGGTL